MAFLSPLFLLGAPFEGVHEPGNGQMVALLATGLTGSWRAFALSGGKEDPKASPIQTGTWAFHQKLYGADFPYQNFAAQFRAELEPRPPTHAGPWRGRKPGPSSGSVHARLGGVGAHHMLVDPLGHKPARLVI